MRWVLGVAVFLALVWVAAARGWGMGLVVRSVLVRSVPEGWTVRVGTVRGDWRSRITVLDLEFTRPGISLSIAELELRYGVGPLLRRTLQATSVDVVRPKVTIDLAAYRVARGDDQAPPAAENEPLPDSWDALLEAWGLADLLGPEPLGGWRLRIGALRMAGAEGRVQMERQGGPEVFMFSAGHASASADVGPGGTHVVLDSLVGRVTPPADSLSDRGSPPPGRFAFAGTLSDGVLTVERLSFDTPRSRVAGSGSLALLPADRRTDRIDFEFSATPLDLRDIPLELPPRIRHEPELGVSLVAKGADDSVRVDGRIRGLASLEADVAMVVRPFRRDEAWEPGTSLPSDRGDRAALDATVTVVRADLSGWTPPPLDGILEGSLDASVSRFAPDTPLRISGTITHRPASAAEAGLLTNPLRAAFRAARASPDEDVDLEMTMSRGMRAGREWIELGRVEARIGRGAATWAVEARLDSAAAFGDGSATWTVDGRTVTVAGLTLENVDARRLHPELPTTSLFGEMSGRLAWRGHEEPSGTLGLVLRPSWVVDYSIDTVTIDARVRGRRIEGSVLAAGLGKRLDTDYRATIGDTDVRADLTALRLAELPEAADGVPPFEMRGRASGQWLLSAAPRRGSLELLLDSARAGGVRAGSAVVTAELFGEQLSADANLNVWARAFGPMLLEARVDARGATAAELDGTLELRALRRHVSGAETIEGVPADIFALEGRPVDSLLAVVSFEELSRFELAGALHPAESGRVSLRGSGVVTADSTAFGVRAHGVLAEPTALLREAVIDSLDLTATGTRNVSGSFNLTARLDLLGGRWRDLSVGAVHTAMRSDSTGLAVDTLIINSNAVSVAGAGRLPAGGVRPGRLEFTAAVLDLEPVRRTIGAEVLASGRARLQFVATGTLDSIDVTTSGSAEAIVYERLGLTGLQLEGSARFEPPFTAYPGGFTTGTLEIALDRLALPDAEVRRVDVRVAGGPDSIVVESSALVDDRRRGDLLVAVDLRPDRRTARIDRLDLSLDRDNWSLAHPTLLSYRDGVSVEAFLLRARSQEIRIEGGFDRSGALDLRAHVDSTDIGTLSDLAGFRGLQGWLGGSVRLRGSTTAPIGRAELAGSFYRMGVSPHATRIAVEMDGRRVTADVDLEDGAGGVLRLDGSAPLPRRPGADTASLDLRLTSEAFGLAWVLPFLDPTVVSQLRGRVHGQLTVGGSMDEPTFRGALELREGSVDIAPLGAQWNQVFGVVRGRGSDLGVDSIRIVSGSGSLTASGGLSLTDGLPLDFDVKLNRFLAIRNQRYRSTVSGEGQVRGTLERPELEGRLFMESLDVFLDERVTSQGLEDVELTDEDLRMLQDRFGYVPQDEVRKPPLFDRLTADVVVDLSRDSWLRKRQSPEMAVAFTGSVEVRLRPGVEPQLAGSVETIAGRGFVDQFGRRFTLRQGTVTFDGPSTSARLDLAAVYTIPSHDNPDDAEATIVLEITGTRDDLALTLSSDPPMENADIVSYLATGRPASGTLSFGESRSQGGLVAAGADLALDQIVGVIEGAAERSVGLDVVEVRRRGLREATLVAGKYVSPRLYVGFAQPVTLRDGDFSLGGGGESQVELELEALRWLLVNLEGTSSALRIFLRGRFAY